MKKQIAVMAVAAALALGACSAMTEPVYEPQVTLATSYDSALVKKAIFKACVERGWVATEVQPGDIRAELNVRDHKVIVDIPYSGQDFAIKYVTSVNMNAENGTIHNKYNHWVNNLKHDIQLNLQQSEMLKNL